MASPLLQGKLHISGMDSCAPALARQWQLGLETIAFSYAPLLDGSAALPRTRAEIHGISSLWLHGPFAELIPCAIDPLARDVAMRRFRQALDAAQALGIAQGAFEHALAYAKDRVQFGKPIAAQQAVSFKLADMATKLRCARFLVYSAAELKEQHAPYGMESAMAKMYASDIALEVTNDALQIHGGSGFLKGMEVERAYRDAKITTIYEGTNEIQRVVIASHLVGRLGKSSGGESRSAAKKPAPITGIRKKTIFREGDAAQQVADLVAALKKDGHDFSVGIPMDTPIPQAERVVSAGKGIGEKKNMKLVESLAKAAGAAIGSSRPVAETLKYLPLNRYVGMSGQKFTGNLYIACGISGQIQHTAGMDQASIVIAINTDPEASVNKFADYVITGSALEVVPKMIKFYKQNSK